MNGFKSLFGYPVIFKQDKTLKAIKEAKKAIAEAKKIKCICSSFVIQYEGSCGCDRGIELRRAETELYNIINNI